MPDRESHRDTQRAHAPRRRRRRGPVNRQRSNRHQMIGAQSVEESEKQGGREQDQDTELYFLLPADTPFESNRLWQVADFVVARLVAQRSFDSRARCMSQRDSLNNAERLRIDELRLVNRLEEELLGCRKLR